MKHILQTNRLLLRELNTNDAENLYYLNSNPNVIKYTGDSTFNSVDEARIFLENYKDYQLNGYGRWAVIDQYSGKFIGWSGLKLGEMKNETDIGFRFFEEEWGKGYASESALACIHYGFEKLNLKRIIGRAMKENSASIRVLEKIGLEYEKEVEFDGEEAVIYKIEQ